MKKYFIQIVIYSAITSTVCICSCNKLVEVTPETVVTGDKLFADDQGAEAAMVGLYQQCMNSFSLLNGYLSRYASLYADEVSRTGSTSTDNNFYNLNLSSGESLMEELWSTSYNYIYQCNAILEKLSASTAVSQSMKQQLTGESKFMRALVYFYLVNMYGDVPLVLQTKVDATANLSRSSQASVYKQMAEDLRNAQELLSFSYPATNSTIPSNRIRPNKAATLALLARVCLYTGDDNNAIIYSSQVIDAGIYKLADSVNDVFAAQSIETIFAMYPVNTLYNTAEGRIFGFAPPAVRPAFVLSSSLLDGFETGDRRKANWIRTVAVGTTTYNIPYKYKVYESGEVLEYNIILRLAELYLIRAEANMHNGRNEVAIEDINKIRKRAGLTELALTLSSKEVQAYLESENQKEFFTELGHRWFDLRRWPATNAAGLRRADEVLSVAKPGQWQSYKLYWPLPAEEIAKSKMLTQNPGYN
ncbi:MAG: RagB/SusD family nutrient uptake outer membrane protein [Chitinophagaceae bacterium]